MDNKIEHFFVLKPDGKIGWIEKMPEKPQPEDFLSGDVVTPFGDGYMNWDAFNYACNVWESERQSAIDNAVEVSNQDEVKWMLLLSGQHRTHGDEGQLKSGTVYSLQCSVEKKEREIAQCCECDKAIYKENRFQRDDGNGFTTSVCPECGEESFYNLKEVLALVTFSQPEREETQEELWDDAIAITGVYYPSTFGRFKVIEELSKTFTITRKTP